jgi:hypothetical protein
MFVEPTNTAAGGEFLRRSTKLQCITPYVSFIHGSIPLKMILASYGGLLLFIENKSVVAPVLSNTPTQKVILGPKLIDVMQSNQISIEKASSKYFILQYNII